MSLLFLYILLITGIFAGEFWRKNRAENRESSAGQTKFILIRRYHNRGAALNLGQRHRRIVAAVSAVFCLLAFICFLLSLGQKGNHLLRLGLAILLGGAFSNTYDRLKRKYVVDYFSFNVKWKPLRRIVFNLSDFCIIAGALLAAIGAP